MQSVLLDAAGHRRSPTTCPAITAAARLATRARNTRRTRRRSRRSSRSCARSANARRCPAPRADSDALAGGTAISEALALQESDLDRSRGAVLVRRGKGGKRREVGMDRWAWDQLDPWLEIRRQLPIGALLCVIHGPTAGRRWEASAARKQLHHAAAAAGIRRRFAPHQPRHAHAVEIAHERVPLVVIQRQLGHANLGITSIYLQGIDSSEIISTVHGRPSPTISATAGLQIRR
ncbi:MAG: site-specific integrase [Solirubrobacterales bacterium]|nr:site-specific integrase [Solirubrobacterales bacterium]